MPPACKNLNNIRIGDWRLILAPLFEVFELAALTLDFLLVALDRLIMFVALNLPALHLVAD